MRSCSLVGQEEADVGIRPPGIPLGIYPAASAAAMLATIQAPEAATTE